MSEPGRPTARRFRAAFLAALRSDLGVPAAACLGRTGGSDGAALRARGGWTCTTSRSTRGGRGLLGAMNRLFAVSRFVPGATALFPGRGGGGEALPACSGTLSGAWLMMDSDFGFCGGAAAAWVRMVCPGLLASAAAR